MLSGGCLEVLWRVWGGFREGVVRMCGGCGETDWGMWGDCKVSEDCLQDLLRLSGRCGEAV